MDSLLDQSGGDVTGNISLAGNALNNVSTINGVNIASAIEYAVNKDAKIASKQDLLNGGNGTQILISKMIPTVTSVQIPPMLLIQTQQINILQRI